MMRKMKIGDLARTAGCQVETIRYYEREELLPEPARTEANYRTYGQRHVERLRFIRNCRSLDMTLDEIRGLLTFCDAPERNCIEVSALLEAHIRHVAHRISELKLLEQQLKDLRQQCSQPGATKYCGILNKLGTGRTKIINSTISEGGHVSGSHSYTSERPRRSR